MEGERTSLPSFRSRHSPRGYGGNDPSEQARNSPKANRGWTASPFSADSCVTARGGRAEIRMESEQPNSVR